MSQNKKPVVNYLGWWQRQKTKTKTKTLVARRAKGLRMNQRIKDRIRKDEH